MKLKRLNVKYIYKASC